MVSRRDEVREQRQESRAGRFVEGSLSAKSCEVGAELVKQVKAD
jgi:hypothetical protein